MRKKILFICGSINQTSQMHQIAQELIDYDIYFTPYYTSGFIEQFRKWHFLEFTIVGHKLTHRCLSYLKVHDLPIDYQGGKNDYDLIITCSDLIIPKNILNKPVILVQEGMTDPENFFFHLVKRFSFLPRWIASTSTTGLSDKYERFCVASYGYRDLFINKGVVEDKIAVTGIPNFDNCKKYLDNAFPFKNYVLVCSSDARETFKYENRKAFIEKALNIAGEKQLIFKIHPNENHARAIQEIKKYAPNALVYTSGHTEEMIANCEVLITRFSSTVYVGMALNKEVYSDFEMQELRKMVPLQNGNSAKNIAMECIKLLERGNYKTVYSYKHRKPVNKENYLSGYAQRMVGFFLKNQL